jgi:hypothetical protein
VLQAMAQPYPVTLPTNNIEALWTNLRRIVKEGWISLGSRRGRESIP